MSTPTLCPTDTRRLITTYFLRLCTRFEDNRRRTQCVSQNRRHKQHREISSASSNTKSLRCRPCRQLPHGKDVVHSASWVIAYQAVRTFISPDPMFHSMVSSTRRMSCLCGPTRESRRGTQICPVNTKTPFSSWLRSVSRLPAVKRPLVSTAKSHTLDRQVPYTENMASTRKFVVVFGRPRTVSSANCVRSSTWGKPEYSPSHVMFRLGHRRLTHKPHGERKE